MQHRSCYIFSYTFTYCWNFAVRRFVCQRLGKGHQQVGFYILLLYNIQVLSVVLMKDRDSMKAQWKSGSLASDTRSVSSLVSNFFGCLTTMVLHNVAYDSHSLYIKR